MSEVHDRPRGQAPTVGGSTYVRPSEMDWKPTRFEKVSIKVLYENPGARRDDVPAQARTRRLHPLSQTS